MKEKKISKKREKKKERKKKKKKNLSVNRFSEVSYLWCCHILRTLQDI